MGKVYSVGKGLERPLEKALENFKIGQPAAISKDQGIQIPVQAVKVFLFESPEHNPGAEWMR